MPLWVVMAGVGVVVWTALNWESVTANWEDITDNWEDA
jgi:hypothetical protein